jgi:LPXTG-motif cell wall-anchored protein
MSAFYTRTRKSVLLVSLVALLTVAFASPASAAPDFQEVVLSGSPASGTSVSLVGDYTVDVTATWGVDGGWSDGHYAGLGIGFYNNVPLGGDNSEAWVRWTFDSAVTSFRIYYGDMEAPDTDFGDPTTFIANVGGSTIPLDLRTTGAGGYRVASSALNAWNEGEFGTDGVVSCATSPCGGWVELSVPAGVTFIEARGSTSGDAGWNEVGVALDVNAPFATPTTTTTVVPATESVAAGGETLPETGSSTTLMVLVGIGLVAVGAFVIRVSRAHSIRN